MIAVTGANGLLGSFIIRNLITNNQPFIAIKRSDSDTTLVADIADKITWRDADVNDPVSLYEALEGVTHVIHAAAIVSFNPRQSKNILKTNVQGTQHVVDASLSRAVKRIVHISSVAALGRQKNQSVINEENKWIESPLNSKYAYSKYQAELEIFRAQEEGISTVIINPSVILAPTDWDRSSSQLFKYVWKQKFFYINGSLNYVDVRDVATIACTLLNAPLQGQRFIVSGGSISFNDFFNLVAKCFNKKAPFIKLNRTFLTLVAFLENFRSVITRSNPLITPETARLADTSFTYDNAKITKALNFRFQTIDKTVQWCCDAYMKKNNHKK
jgi:nucleoside-diphosphate-sugar epimerase